MEIRGIKKYKYKYDLHIHTAPTSTCADFSPEEVSVKYAELGFCGFVLTNHFTPVGLSKHSSCKSYADYYLEGYYETKAAGKALGIDVIFGIEIRFPENTNDYLVYGACEEDIYLAAEYLNTDYKTFYKEFKRDTNVIVQAHPFRDSAVLQDIDYLDGIEVFNLHPGHNARIGIAAKLAEQNPRLLITGGTDFHHEGHQGMCAFCTAKKQKTSFDIAKTIMSRDYIFDIRGNKIVI